MVTGWATDSILAVRVGFEPTEPVKVQRFSRPPDSTALAPHQILILACFPIRSNKFLTNQADGTITYVYLPSPQVLGLIARNREAMLD